MTWKKKSMGFFASFFDFLSTFFSVSLSIRICLSHICFVSTIRFQYLSKTFEILSCLLHSIFSHLAIGFDQHNFANWNWKYFDLTIGYYFIERKIRNLKESFRFYKNVNQVYSWGNFASDCICWQNMRCHCEVCACGACNTTWNRWNMSTLAYTHNNIHTTDANCLRKILLKFIRRFKIDWYFFYFSLRHYYLLQSG